MIRVVMRYIAALIVMASAIASPAGASVAVATVPISSLVVFGDSLVDAGNFQNVFPGNTPDPALGYFQNRFTNGYDYTDLLSMTLTGAPTVASTSGGSNYGFGGARIVPSATLPIPNVTAQVAQYASSLTGPVDPNALFVLNFGGNDLFAMLSGDLGGRSIPQYVNEMIATYATAVATLDGLGARHIFITDMPSVDPTVQAINSALNTALDSLLLNSNTTLYRYSLSNFLYASQVKPGTVGLPALDTTTPCLNAGAAPACAGYYYFDSIHPTAIVHEAAAADILRQFNFVSAAAVPEPESWVLLIIGFGTVGAGVRRARRLMLIAA